MNDTATKLAPYEILPNANKSATALTKIANALYSRVKKTIAPSLTARPMAHIFSFPVSCLFIHFDLMNA